MKSKNYMSQQITILLEKTNIHSNSTINNIHNPSIISNILRKKKLYNKRYTLTFTYNIILYIGRRAKWAGKHTKKSAHVLLDHFFSGQGKTNFQWAGAGASGYHEHPLLIVTLYHYLTPAYLNIYLVYFCRKNNKKIK